MIKINLAKKKRAGFAGSGGGGGGGAGGINVDLDEIRELPLLSFALVIITYFGGDYFLSYQKDISIEEVAKEIAVVSQKTQALTLELAKSKGFESKKKEIEENEFTIKTKIETIDKLLAGKTKSVDMLTFISNSVPTDVWISDFNLTEESLSIRGAAPTFDLVAEFQKKLGESVYFSSIDPGQSNQKEDKSVGIEIFEFSIVAELRRQEEL